MRSLTSSSNAFQTITRWREECLSTHRGCQSAAFPVRRLPTRLLFVKGADITDTVLIKSSHDLIDRPNLYEMFGMLSTEAFGLTVNLDSDTVTVVRHGTSRYYRMIRFLVVKEEEGRCFAWRGIFNSDRKDQPTLNPVQL